MKMNVKTLVCRFTAFAVAICMISSGHTVYAVDSVKDLEGTTSSLEGELSNLNTKADKLAAELSKASDNLKQVSAQVKETKKELAKAKLNEETQYSNMKARIKYMYEGGNTTFLELLLESGSMAEFLNNAEFISQISEYDRNMLIDYQKIKQTVEDEEAKLTQEQEDLEDSRDDLKTKQSDLESQISSKSSALSKYKAQLEEAKAAEAAAAAALAQQQAEEAAAAERAAEEAKANASGGSQNNGSTTDTSGKTTNTGDSEAASASTTELFAALLQAEAGSSYNGCLAVATVVMNRVNSSRYPNSIKGVIYQSGQFAPTWNGSLNRIIKSGAVSNARKAANDALAGKRLASVSKCYSFRSAATTSHKGVNVGGNIFF